MGVWLHKWLLNINLLGMQEATFYSEEEAMRKIWIHAFENGITSKKTYATSAEFLNQISGFFLRYGLPLHYSIPLRNFIYLSINIYKYI